MKWINGITFSYQCYARGHWWMLNSRSLTGAPANILQCDTATYSQLCDTTSARQIGPLEQAMSSIFVKSERKDLALISCFCETVFFLHQNNVQPVGLPLVCFHLLLSLQFDFTILFPTARNRVTIVLVTGSNIVTHLGMSGTWLISQQDVTLFPPHWVLPKLSLSQTTHLLHTPAARLLPDKPSHFSSAHTMHSQRLSCSIFPCNNASMCRSIKACQTFFHRLSQCGSSLHEKVNVTMLGGSRSHSFWLRNKLYTP